MGTGKLRTTGILALAGFCLNLEHIAKAVQGSAGTCVSGRREFANVSPVVEQLLGNPDGFGGISSIQQGVEVHDSPRKCIEPQRRDWCRGSTVLEQAGSIAMVKPCICLRNHFFGDGIRHLGFVFVQRQ